MIDKITNLIQVFDKCSIRTQLIMLIAFVVFFIIIWKLIIFILNILKNGITTEKILNFFKTLINIVKKLELKTIAGLVNLIMSIGLLILTLTVFISVSFSGLIGITENVSLNKLLLVFITVFMALISVWALYKFEKESKILGNGSA